MRPSESTELESILSKFGDEKSNLVDRYERLSFEIQLNQAMLARCLSDHSYNINNPSLTRTGSVVVPQSREEPGLVQTSKSKEGSVFRKALKKILKPVLLLGGRSRRHNNMQGDHDDHHHHHGRNKDQISTTTDDHDHHELKMKKKPPFPWRSWNKSFSRSARH